MAEGAWEVRRASTHRPHGRWRSEVRRRSGDSWAAVPPSQVSPPEVDTRDRPAMKPQAREQSGAWGANGWHPRLPIASQRAHPITRRRRATRLPPVGAVVVRARANRAERSRRERDEPDGEVTSPKPSTRSPRTRSGRATCVVTTAAGSASASAIRSTALAQAIFKVRHETDTAQVTGSGFGARRSKNGIGVVTGHARVVPKTPTVPNLTTAKLVFEWSGAQKIFDRRRIGGRASPRSPSAKPPTLPARAQGGEEHVKSRRDAASAAPSARRYSAVALALEGAATGRAPRSGPDSRRRPPLGLRGDARIGEAAAPRAPSPLKETLARQRSSSAGWARCAVGRDEALQVGRVGEEHRRALRILE